jgi:hypothetical protein
VLFQRKSMAASMKKRMRIHASNVINMEKAA